MVRGVDFYFFCVKTKRKYKRAAARYSFNQINHLHRLQINKIFAEICLSSTLKRIHVLIDPVVATNFLMKINFHFLVARIIPNIVRKIGLCEMWESFLGVFKWLLSFRTWWNSLGTGLGGNVLVVSYTQSDILNGSIFSTFHNETTTQTSRYI